MTQTQFGFKTKPCPVCVIGVVVHPRRRYCSDTCKLKAAIVALCANESCRKAIHYDKRQKYCSPKCVPARPKQLDTRTCEWCQQEFTREIRRNQRTCSYQCQAYLREQERGNKHAISHEARQEVLGVTNRVPSISEVKRYLWELQDRACGICSKHLQAYQDSHLDHSHETGKIRGLLCHKCNTGLGLLGDNKAAVLNTLRYLDDNNG